MTRFLRKGPIFKGFYGLLYLTKNTKDDYNRDSFIYYTFYRVTTVRIIG